MCGPNIPGQFGSRSPRFEGRPGEEGEALRFGRLFRRRVNIPEPTEAETAEMESVERRRKVTTGGRQATILAGGGVAREARKRSLLTAATAAEQQRKTLLGQ